MPQTGRTLEDTCGSQSTSCSGISIEYAAFRQLNYAAYVDYAHVRTGNQETAMRCADITFDKLWTIWQTALRESPAARGWELLREQVEDLSTCSSGHDWTAHCLLQADNADAILLHRRLGLSVTEAAGLMGLPDYAVRGLLRTSDRMLGALPPCLAPLVAELVGS
ncbi:hypothetical protein GCM10010446_26720 [Streptomyces enissocaesilis]|uniref:RNA polymerase sigma factor 70 region 4 type 2 domain-containing protein n=1 Tax=Streptomyces enissocaesilis TaxID=332589 RepID=A0ABP6JPL1_9ACTN